MSDNNEIRLIGSGDKVSLDSFKKDVQRSDLEGLKSVKLFDYYAGEDKVLDETEFANLFSDMESYSQNTEKIVANSKEIMELYESKDVRDRTFEPDEILRFLKDKKLDKQISVMDVVEFFNKIAVVNQTEQLNEDISAMAMKSRTLKDLQAISPENMSIILNTYKEKYGMSMLQHIAYKNGARGSTREEHINVIRDKLIEQAELYSVSSDEFKAEFDAEVKNMDMTWLSSSDAPKLDDIVNKFLAKLAQKEKLYKENKGGILQMMADPDLCWTGADKNELANNIIKYANKINFAGMIDNYAKNAKSSKIRAAAKSLKDAKYPDYFPIYMAAIISKESRFREFDDAIFTNNGQGVMQLTKTLLEDMHLHSSRFDDEFMDYLEDSGISDVDNHYDALFDREDSGLNMYTGAAGLKYKMDRALVRISNGYYNKNFKGINTKYPEVIMQLMAMEYNANGKQVTKDEKLSKKYGKTLRGEIRHVYSRDVIERFKKYTPAGVSVKHYYEYNPLTKKLVTY